MNWFEEQIRERRKADDELFSEAMMEMAGVVMGEKLRSALNNDRIITKNAIDEVLKYYHVKSQELPQNVKEVEEQLNYLCRFADIMRREVELKKGWYKDAIGAMLGVLKEDGTVVALIPHKIAGYTYKDPKTGKWIRLNKKTQELLEEEAICFYKPFPLRSMGLIDLVKYLSKSLEKKDYLWIILMTVAVTLIGMIIPVLNNILYSKVVTSDSIKMLLSLITFMFCVGFSQKLIEASKSLIMSRISGRMKLAVESAAMMRVLSLPTGFFKDYSSGELASRVGMIHSLCEMLTVTTLTAGLSSVFSLAYIGQMIHYGPELVVPSMIVIIVTVLCSAGGTILRMYYTKRQMESAAKESGLVYSLITGIQKIKLAGAEKRAFAKWASIFKEEAGYQYDPPMIIKMNSVFTLAVSLIGTLVIYYFTIKSRISLADYYSFNSSFGMIQGAFSALIGMAATIASIRPIYEMVKPIFKCAPEISDKKKIVTRLSGGIELNNVSFRYNESMPNVLDNLSIKIRSGQYVAIVGKTGCGKSTLLRLLLGFEKPQKGAIYYDGRDITSLDLKSLRQHIGTVMQNGKLFPGDIYSNIVVCAPRLTLEDAWEAAEISGMAEDIKEMPMGMYTVIAEGAGGISGGQKQRLMIARAIAPKPKILMFDEATSALDNITQKKVSNALDELKCTRLIIAHRLSTIKNCDRIIVMDQGKIIEDGTYEELICQEGYFANLVERQRIEER